MSDSSKRFKRKLTGKVVNNKSDKTIVVNVQRRFTHPVYSKYVNKSKKYHAHDENNTAKIGDLVTIIESRAHSKLKKWELISIK